MADVLGWRSRIGIVMPSTNTSLQPECENLRPRGVTNHVARVAIQERPISSESDFMEHVESMRAGIGDAIDRVVTCGPDHLIMGVALEAFWGGVEQAEKLRLDLKERAAIDVTMGSDAARAALEAYNAKRIAVLTPHQPRGDEMVEAYLKEAGYNVVRLKGLRCPSPRQIAHTQPETVRSAYRDLDGADVDAILQVGTNLAGMDVAAEAERWLEKPVLCMNVITYWRALRLLGIDDKVFGRGRILEEH